jgi:Phenazine biosynthesis-like protein
MEIMRYVAFSTDPAGGNPAGVVLDAAGLDDDAMLRIAADIGFSETAFLTQADDDSFAVRYFSPLTEVPFCGHATIALAVAYAERHGPGELYLRTLAGPVTVATKRTAEGSLAATLVSVAPRSTPIMGEDLAGLLAALRWPDTDLDPALPPRAAYAGAWHPVIAAATRARLADLGYDMEALADLPARARPGASSGNDHHLPGPGSGSARGHQPPHPRRAALRSRSHRYRSSDVVRGVAPGDEIRAWRGSERWGADRACLTKHEEHDALSGASNRHERRLVHQTGALRLERL